MKTLRIFRLEYAMVPLLLTGIALNQMRMVRSANLSPWKGGGFGMFSSVDSPGVRRVLCKARLSDDRYVTVELKTSSDVGGLVSTLRTVPTVETLELLGQRLLRTPLVNLNYRENALLERLHQENPDVDLAMVSMPADLDVMRPLTAGDPPLNITEAIFPEAVQLEVLRVSWDAQEARISLTPILEPIVLESDRDQDGEQKS